MAQHTVVTMPGDGIGKIVLPQALRVLEAVDFDAEFVPADIGWECWTRDGNALPERTVELLQRHKLGLLGAITSKPPGLAETELAPHLQGRGLAYASAIVRLRQRLKLDLCLRPCRSFPGNPLNYVRCNREGRLEEPAIDAVIFRQNTEGLYAGLEWTHPPEALHSALASHPAFSFFSEVPPGDIALTVRLFTRAACRRIVRAAFAYAEQFGYGSVTVCDKQNVLRETSEMLEAAAREAQTEFPTIEHRSTNIDTQMMWLSRNPEDYGVIVAGNMFGDIVSDAYAGLVGGLGFAASGNIGDDFAVFEPTHGSAPKHMRKPPALINPIAAVLSGCMLLDHVGEREKAERVREAIAVVVRRSECRTYDMLRLRPGEDPIAAGAATTLQMTEAILQQL